MGVASAPAMHPTMDWPCWNRGRTTSFRRRTWSLSLTCPRGNDSSCSGSRYGSNCRGEVFFLYATIKVLIPTINFWIAVRSADRKICGTKKQNFSSERTGERKFASYDSRQLQLSDKPPVRANTRLCELRTKKTLQPLY